jgi:ketosteroid isomerase-like protein
MPNRVAMTLRRTLPALLLAVATLPALAASPVGVPPALQAEIEAVVHDTAARWNSQDYASVMDLWDRDEPNVMYLAEEQPGWFVGWGQLKAYLGSSTPFIEAIREEMSNIRVQPIAADLAAVTWDMHFEMKQKGVQPIGEDIRVTAIMRRKAEGWRYIHYAEAPMTASMYMRKLMQQDVDPEKFRQVMETGRQRRAAKSAP